MTVRVMSAAFFMAYALCGKEIDWSILDVSDTLDLFMGGQKVGIMMSAAAVDAKAKKIREYVFLDMRPSGAASNDGNFMKLTENREYDYNGKLSGASQEIKSPSGVSTWVLKRTPPNTWSLESVVGSTKSVVGIDSVDETLESIYEMCTGIIRATVKKGDSWKSSVFEMFSGRSIGTTTRCEETGNAGNGFTWTFVSNDEATGRDEKWVLGKDLKTRMREMSGMYVARARNSGPGTPAAARQPSDRDFAELFKIPMPKHAGKNEKICLHLDSAGMLHHSVRRFYETGGKLQCVKQQPASCVNIDTKSLSDTFSTWLRPTSTIQSNAKEIVDLASKIAGKKTESCRVIADANSYVFRTIKKRNSATFSNALETLKAGFGDCGEHAVLLAAILRAAGVPARVVLGLIYMDSKKGYYYHAWVLAYSGQWLFADPAFGQFPAPDRKIPLIIDDTGREAMALARLMGEIEISHIAR